MSSSNIVSATFEQRCEEVAKEMYASHFSGDFPNNTWDQLNAYEQNSWIDRAARKIRKERKHSFDEKCLELAEHFTQDLEFVDKHELAQAIQNAVEDFLHG